MAESTDTVVLSKDIEELIPEFLANRRRDVENLRRALAANDLAEVRRIGHRMKGVGGSFGFVRISRLGARIEAAATAADGKTLESCISHYADYCDAVIIRYE